MPNIYDVDINALKYRLPQPGVNATKETNLRKVLANGDGRSVKEKPLKNKSKYIFKLKFICINFIKILKNSKKSKIFVENFRNIFYLRITYNLVLNNK